MYGYEGVDVSRTLIYDNLTQPGGRRVNKCANRKTIDPMTRHTGRSVSLTD